MVLPNLKTLQALKDIRCHLDRLRGLPIYLNHGKYSCRDTYLGKEMPLVKHICMLLLPGCNFPNAEKGRMHLVSSVKSNKISCFPLGTQLCSPSYNKEVSNVITFSQNSFLYIPHDSIFKALPKNIEITTSVMSSLHSESHRVCQITLIAAGKDSFPPQCTLISSQSMHN